MGGIDPEGAAPMLIGTGHLLVADREAPPSADVLRRMVASVVAPDLDKND